MKLFGDVFARSHWTKFSMAMWTIASKDWTTASAVVSHGRRHTSRLVVSISVIPDSTWNVASENFKKIAGRHPQWSLLGRLHPCSLLKISPERVLSWYFYEMLLLGIQCNNSGQVLQDVFCYSSTINTKLRRVHVVVEEYFEDEITFLYIRFWICWN